MAIAACSSSGIDTTEPSDEVPDATSPDATSDGDGSESDASPPSSDSAVAGDDSSEADDDSMADDAATDTEDPSETGDGDPSTSDPETDDDPPATTVAPIECGDVTPGATEIELDAFERSYTTYVPDDLGTPGDLGDVARPALILLHGFGGNGVERAASTGLDEIAPDAGVVLVAPQGIGEVPTWHIGGSDQAVADSDVAFLDAIIDSLASSECVDADNIWLAGFSAGSAYAGVYGCGHTDRLAGIGMASGLPPAICPDDADVSIQITHGTDDVIVPFGGGEQTTSDVDSVDLGSVPASSAEWAARAGCGESAESIFGETNRSVVTSWTDCRGGASVSLLAVEGLNHAWAGGEQAPEFFEPISPIVDAGCVLVQTMIDPELDPFPPCFS